ncbi:Mitoferrin-1, partial [Fragariocoptes setiger]
MNVDQDGDPYETLPGENTKIYMTAGAMAGILEHCIMYPVDVVKTRMQSIRPQKAYSTISGTLRKIIQTEGIARPFRGMTAVVSGAGPAHALYFACYENIKFRILSSTTSSTIMPGHHNFKKSLAHGAAGCCATLLHDAVMNPAEVVKQRMQMYNSPFRKSLNCARHILRTEGLQAFYRSYATQLTMNLPYQSIHFIVYELMQDLTNPEHKYNPAAHMVSGGIAGAIASGATTPLDVCKTLLNTQERLALVAAKRSDHVTGLFDAMSIIYRCCGFRGYFQGIKARVVFAIPSTAISWSVYEFFKFFLNKNNAC